MRAASLSAAFLLALYEAQWRAADPAWDLTRRPESTATPDQIGFARSRPHVAPRANEVAAEVGRVFHSAWVEEHFGAATGGRATPPDD